MPAQRRATGGRLFEAILEWLPYFEKEMLGLRTLVPRNGVCVDVGAAGGTYAYLLARLVGPQGRVYAIEPRAPSARFLERARRLLDLEQVSVHQIALAEEPRSEVLYVPRRRGIPFTTRAFLRRGLPDGDSAYREFTSTDPVQVECVPLDLMAERWSLERLDLLKLDVEGAELWALRGAARTLERFHPTILCEIEARHLAKYELEPADVLGWLGERGYRPFRFVGGSFHPVDQVTEAENNYLFVRG